MKTKKKMRLSGVCLSVVGITLLLFSGSRLIGILLPDIVLKIFVLIDIIALPAYFYLALIKNK